MRFIKVSDDDNSAICLINEDDIKNVTYRIEDMNYKIIVSTYDGTMYVENFADDCTYAINRFDYIKKILNKEGVD